MLASHGPCYGLTAHGKAALTVVVVRAMAGDGSKQDSTCGALWRHNPLGPAHVVRCVELPTLQYSATSILLSGSTVVQLHGVTVVSHRAVQQIMNREQQQGRL